MRSFEARSGSKFGFNRLIEAEGKAIVGDFVSIIQHPGGEKKQVALREDWIVDLLDLFVHYETDTEPGSSGSTTPKRVSKRGKTA